MRCNRIVLFLLAASLLFLCSCGTARAAEQVPAETFLDSLTFLGDSTTAHMQQRSSLRSEQIWATKERYLNLDSRITYAKILHPVTGEENTIAQVAASLRPAYLVITLGVDYGAYYYRDKPDVFRLYYEKLLSAIQKASPDTRLILQSVFPVGRNSGAVTNDMVNRVNANIQRIARERGLPFVDQTPILADEEGFLRPEYCYSEDGLHLTASAYEAILCHLASQEREIRGAA